MSEIFNKLCKGPVVIVDDEVNKPGTEIVKFLEEIQKHHLPVLKYETPRIARNELKGLVFSNFVIFDWMFKKTSEEDIFRGVQTGAAEKQTQEERPLERIIGMKEGRDGIEISTTNEHLVARIAKSIHRVFGGKLELKYAPEEKFAVAHWHRE